MVWLLPQPQFNKVVAAAAAQNADFRSRQHAVAQSVQLAAIGEALPHRRSGDQIDSIVIRDRNRTDLEVVDTDSEAWHIEFGHEAPDGSWVRGLHTMRNATLASGGIVNF
ncbi:MAG: DUF5403 family protein [Arcanobacterium sp.]|nr:DUF5403 family protein [Arcanobacterium sp.]